MVEDLKALDTELESGSREFQRRTFSLPPRLIKIRKPDGSLKSSDPTHSFIEKSVFAKSPKSKQNRSKYCFH